MVAEEAAALEVAEAAKGDRVAVEAAVVRAGMLTAFPMTAGTAPDGADSMGDREAPVAKADMAAMETRVQPEEPGAAVSRSRRWDAHTSQGISWRKEAPAARA